MFELAPQLANDTKVLGNLPLSQLLLMNHATNPWLILVPRIAGLSELYELTPQDQQQLMHEITAVSRILDKCYTPQKMNVAALGNMVSQLHIHVIARYLDDPAWPKPVWGHLEVTPYDEIALQRTLHMLREQLTAIPEFQAL